MILLRDVQLKDLDALEKFSKIPGLFNLPEDKDALKDKVRRSVNSFEGKAKKKSDRKFIFVAENIDNKKIFATSMIASQHGTEASPHFYFQLDHEKRFSKTINTGFIHGTLELKADTDGPSEIGGLVVDPEMRNSDLRVGRQISFVRFLFFGLNRKLFKDQIIAELLPPLNKRGKSPLWEAIGRKFTNMDYWEADALCASNKEFIYSLFPEGKFYTTFMAAEARNAIGKVGKATAPVFHMLKKIGFEYKDQIDPFDGGPHLWADADKISMLDNIGHYNFQLELNSEDAQHDSGIMTLSNNKSAGFKAISGEFVLQGNQIAFLKKEDGKKAAALLQIKSGDSVAFMPYY